MPDWHDVILEALPSGLSPATVVYDADSLLREQEILDKIRERGFHIVEIGDPVQFRFAWESQFRVYWDAGDTRQVLILIAAAPHGAPSLPFDVWTNSQIVHYSLAQLFPQLEYSVLRCLDPGLYEQLYHAVQLTDIETVGTNATMDFVLRHVYGIVPEVIRTAVDLLRMLLRRHYLRQSVPELLDDRMVTLLQDRSQLAEWPIQRLMRDRSAFLEFLQGRWTAFVEAAGCPIACDTEFTVAGPRELPFDHDDIRVYIDNYLTDGLLQAVTVGAEHAFLSGWHSVGVTVDRTVAARERAMRLSSRLVDELPTDESERGEWLRFAFRWSELSVLTFSTAGLREEVKWDSLRHKVDTAFKQWLDIHYAGLANLPPRPPAMVHHVPKYAAGQLHDRGRRVAMVVIDGLSVCQWVAIRDILTEQEPDLGFEEGATFAWLPTLTCVSRQALFAGVPPLYFGDSLDSTGREAKMWTRFWSQQGIHEREVAYRKGLGRDDGRAVAEILGAQHIRVLGLVVDTVDHILHGMQLGSAGMISQVRQWCREGYLARLLRLLLDNAYLPIIVSDHGNTEARGCGRVSEGAVSEVRGQRVRVCRERSLCERVASLGPGSHAGFHDGLPNDYWPVYPPIGTAFVPDGVTVVAHGGDSLDEVVVPVVTVHSVEARV